MNGDFMKFSEAIDSKTSSGYAKKVLTNYLAGQKKQNRGLRKLVSKLIPWKFKVYIKQNILRRKTKNDLSSPKEIELERLQSILFSEGTVVLKNV